MAVSPRSPTPDAIHLDCGPLILTPSLLWSAEVALPPLDVALVLDEAVVGDAPSLAPVPALVLLAPLLAKAVSVIGMKVLMCH
jgi:hypothetical protein